MKRLIGKISVVLLALLVAGALSTAPTHAADASADSASINGIDLTCATYDINWQVTVPDTLHTYELVVYNPRTGTSSGSGLLNVGYAGTIYFNSSGPAPSGSKPGDTWKITVNVYHPVTLDSSYIIGVECAPPPQYTVCPDGRINLNSCAGPVALYCDGDVLQAYAIDGETGDGVLAFTFSDWSDVAPSKNTVAASKGDLKLYHLASGEYQMNGHMPNENGKVYAFVFNGCPYNGEGYSLNLDPNG